MKISVKIIQEDIDVWRDGHDQHPLVGGLKRATNTCWRWVEPIMIVEKEPPFRTLVLNSHLLLKLLDCKNGDCPVPLECEVELMSPFSE